MSPEPKPQYSLVCAECAEDVDDLGVGRQRGGRDYIGGTARRLHHGPYCGGGRKSCGLLNLPNSSSVLYEVR